MYIYYGLIVFSRFLALFPDRVLNLGAHTIAYFAFKVFRLRRSIVLGNLRQAFGNSISDSDIYSIAQKSYYHFACTILEFFRGYFVSYTDQVELKNTEAIRRHIDKGEGVFVLCLHMGNWEVMSAAVSLRIAPAFVIVKKVGSDAMDRFVSDIRKKNGANALKRGKGEGLLVKKVLQHIRNGDIVGFVMDQSRPGEEYIDLFGKPAKTNSGLATFVSRTNASVVPGYARRLSFGKHQIIFKDSLPLDPKDTPIRERSLNYNKIIEEIILENPEQYFWFHRRWK